jgi:hypothetical protein
MRGFHMRKRLLVAVGVVAVVALIAPSASALSKPRLSFVKSGGATIGWSTTGGSSPEDTYPNGASIRIVAPAGGGASAYTYGASETLVGIRGEHLAGIDHLGFDSRGYLGAGAPRISLGTVDSTGAAHTFFLSAYYCNDPIGNGWRTSDFTDSADSAGTSTGCTIFDQSGNTFPSLQAAGAFYPTDVVVSNPNDWFLVQDESPATLNVDRLSVENWMWVRGGRTGIINCNTGDCI